ncbi:hypothetical protein, partial [Mesorhizobium sp.]
IVIGVGIVWLVRGA